MINNNNSISLVLLKSKGVVMQRSYARREDGEKEDTIYIWDTLNQEQADSFDDTCYNGGDPQTIENFPIYDREENPNW